MASWIVYARSLVYNYVLQSLGVMAIKEERERRRDVEQLECGGRVEMTAVYRILLVPMHVVCATSALSQPMEERGKREGTNGRRVRFSGSTLWVWVCILHTVYVCMYILCTMHSVASSCRACANGQAQPHTRCSDSLTEESRMVSVVISTAHIPLSCEEILRGRGRGGEQRCDSECVPLGRHSVCAGL
jgi:hypothetical protein